MRNCWINIADIINLLLAKPFSIEDRQIKRFINAKNASDIYEALETIAADLSLENVFFFYQGFTIRSPEFRLSLRPSIEGDDETRTLSIEKIGHIFSHRKDLNFLMFIDSSYSALAFKVFDSQNYAIIASSASNQDSYIIRNDENYKSISVFTLALIKSLQQIKLQNGDIVNVNDMFLHLRSLMAELLEKNNRLPTDQLPELSTKNLTPYLKLITDCIEHDETSYSLGDLQGLIINDKIEIVFSVLKNHNIYENYNDLILLENQFNKAKRERALNFIKEEDYKITYVRCLDGLLGTINKIKQDNPDIWIK